ncbi:MAG: DUF480 domain-containing protein [Sulfuricella sp.]|nr:DUF480 domain-containing protein [Sulfuricella sp.]
MTIQLTLYETRVIGALIEKEITTPEQYPLSLNALVNACNQKSNREPVLELDESTVQETLDELTRKHLVSAHTGYGSRVSKYQHRFCNTEFGVLKFTAQELGIVCALFLRGPQTPGELRTHTNRLCQFNDMQEVEHALKQLMERNDGPYVARLAREPGKREARYMHLFSGDAPPLIETEPATSRASGPNPEHERLSRLEQRIDDLEQEVELLKYLLEQQTAGKAG